MNEQIRRCVPDDAVAMAAIYDPIVANTAISFEETPPGAQEMRRRIALAGERYPWLAFEREGRLAGYVRSSKHRERAAYRWSVDVGVYVDPAVRRGGIGRRLYLALFEVLAAQGYFTAIAGVVLPTPRAWAYTAASVFPTSARTTTSALNSAAGTTSCG